MGINLPRRIALLEKRLVQSPEPVRLLPGEWPYASGWPRGETTWRLDRKDRIFTPGATVAEFRLLNGERQRLKAAEDKDLILRAGRTHVPRWALLAKMAFLLLWSPEEIAIELAWLTHELDQYPEVCDLGPPLPIPPTLANYLETEPMTRMFRALDARA